MSFTLLEGAIAIVIVVIAWRIGVLLAPRIMHRWAQRRSRGKAPPDQKDKPPYIIDI